MQPRNAANQKLALEKVVKPATKNQTLASVSSNLDGPPKKQTAVPAGPRNGGKSEAKALASNLQSGNYPAQRLEAIALLVDPLAADLDAIDALIEAADALEPDCDLEPSFGSESFGHPGSDECEIDPDLEESLSLTDGRAQPVLQFMADLERDFEDQDPSECPAHLPGGNGEWLPGGYPLPETREARQ